MRRSILVATAALIVAILVGYCAMPAHAAEALPRYIPVTHVISANATVASYDEASLTHHRPIPRWQAFLWALRHKGQPYVWGACGPFGCNGLWYGFDCSGLIYASYRAIGWPYFGRDTYDMLGYGLASGRLKIIPLKEEKAGDLLFYGTGHVGMATGHWGWTYEALNQSLPVGFYSWSWYGYPSLAVHVVSSG